MTLSHPNLGTEMVKIHVRKDQNGGKHLKEKKNPDSTVVWKYS